MNKEQTTNTTTEQPKLIDNKFESAEALLNAYNSLEVEFTKRSQKLKELEEQVISHQKEKKWETKVKELQEKFPSARGLTSEIQEFLSERKELINDENCLEQALLAVLAGKYQSENSGASAVTKSEPKTIAEKASEVKAILARVPEHAPFGGEIPLTLPLKPKSIKEAGEIAKNIFKNSK
ncbi:MAG: hypothetical protein FWD49_06680 [Firmicutes bacterium]|nr:hypothetical protein [Bacillota bacterium]